MSDTFGDTPDFMQNQTCRVAYTLNNMQPVVCTIIGDQPLFYMDFEHNYEDVDDMSFDAAASGILESEMQTLRKEIQSIEQLSSEFMREPEEKVLDFLADKDIITSRDIVIEDHDINMLKDILSQSRVADAYMKCADEYGVEMKYSAQIETAHYDRSAGIIFINPNIKTASQLLVAAQELRRHWQHRQGALIHPLMFHPDNAVLIHRAQVADLVTSMVRVAWELQLSGEKEAWEAIENSSMADLGRAFAREAFLDFRTINNGQASASVFEAWFLSERCRAQDKILINQMLADYKGYVFDLEEAEQNITPTLISALGEMPFGKNYLAEHAITIMDDAIFTDVRDRSNANFLWFIKFERSFRETEQELQTSSGTQGMDVRSSAAHQETQGQINGSTQAADANIVQLYSEGAEGNKNVDKSANDKKRLAPKPRAKRRNGEDEPSNVVFLRRWSGE